jgi:hypothetical protein
MAATLLVKMSRSTVPAAFAALRTASVPFTAGST